MSSFNLPKASNLVGCEYRPIWNLQLILVEGSHFRSKTVQVFAKSQGFESKAAPETGIQAMRRLKRFTMSVFATDGSHSCPAMTIGSALIKISSCETRFRRQSED